MRPTAIPREGKAKACNPCRPARWEQPIGHLPEAVQTAPMRPASFCKWQQQLFKPLQQVMLQVEGWSKRRGIAPAVNGASKAKKETPTAEMRRARWTTSRTNALAAPLAWTLIVRLAGGILIFLVLAREKPQYYPNAALPLADFLLSVSVKQIPRATDE